MKRFGLFCLALLLATPAMAQKDPGEQVRLSLERYANLMRIAEARSGAKVTWGRGSISVSVDDEAMARVTVTARIRAVGDGQVEVALLPAEAVVQEARIAGNNAALTRLSGAHVALLPSMSGEQEVRLVYLAPVEKGDDGGVFAMIPLPPMPGASLSVSGLEGASEVWPAVGVTRDDDSLSASVPATPALLLRWGRPTGRELVRRVDYGLSLDESGDGVDVEARYEVVTTARDSKIRITGTNDALIDLREGATALVSRVEDEWHTAIIEKPGRHILIARYRLAIDRSRGQPQVTLKPDNVPMAQVTITVPGKRSVEFEPAVPTTTNIKGEEPNALTTATAFLPPTDEIILRWTEARAAPESQVRANTETYQLLTLEEGVLRSKTYVKYDVINGKLKELPIALPEDVVLYKVEGAGIEDWRIFPATEDRPRHVSVVLGKELEGSLQIQLQLEMVVKTKEGTALTLPVVRPLNAFRELGVVALFDGEKVGFAPADVTRFTKVGQDALPIDIRQTLRDKVNQAYKHVGEPGTLASKVATAKAREIRFDARVDTLYQVKEGSLQGNAAVLVELKSGRRDHIMISLPEGLAEPRITAPSLNKVDPDKSFDAGPGRLAYAVRFTQALEGAIQLDVEFERIFEKDQEGLDLPDVRVHGAEVESGSFGIAAETGMELTPGEAKDLRRVTAEELPKAVRLRSEEELRLAYTYARAPWGLKLGIKRNKTVETLDAVAEHVWFESNVLENGHLVTRATYAVANEDRQFLKLKLPDGAQVLTVKSDGRKVKAVQDASGTVAIPLPKSRTVAVEVTYDVAGDDLGVYEGVGLTAPVADLRTNDIQWLVRVPSRLTALGWDTDLKELNTSFNGPGGDVLPTESRMNQKVFGYSVQDAGSEALTISVTLATAPGEGTHLFLFLLALLALLLVTRHRALGNPMGGKQWFLLAVGIGLLAVKASAWGLGGTEAFLVVGLIIVVGFIARKRRAPVEA